MKQNNSLLSKTVRLAWPTMLEELLGTSVQYADTFMVGALGTAATAAVGSTTTVNWLVGSTVSALSVGFLAVISRALGAGDSKKAVRASSQAVFTALVTGIFFTAVTLSLSRFVPVWMQADEEIREEASRYFFIIYSPMLFRAASIIFGTVLRSAGDTKTPMRVGIISNIVNVAGNFFLIFPTRQVDFFSMNITVPGAGLGVTGAALATAFSYITGGVLISATLFRHSVIAPRRKYILPDREILKPCLKIAFPNMLQRFCTSLGYVAFASMINSLGSISTAAHTVANTVESLFYIPGYGMQTAAATLTGNAIGARDSVSLKKLHRLFSVAEIILMGVSGTLLFIFAPRLAGLFSKETAVIALGASVLRMVAVSEPFYGVSIVTEGMLQGAGKTSVPFAINVACMWGVRILGTCITINVLGMGLRSAWGCMIADNMLLLVLFVIYFSKIRDSLIEKGDA